MVHGPVKQVRRAVLQRAPRRQQREVPRSRGPDGFVGAVFRSGRGAVEGTTVIERDLRVPLRGRARRVGMRETQQPIASRGERAEWMPVGGVDRF